MNYFQLWENKIAKLNKKNERRSQHRKNKKHGGRK